MMTCIQNHDEETDGSDGHRCKCTMMALTITLTIHFHTTNPASRQRWTVPMKDHSDATARIKPPDALGVDHRISATRGSCSCAASRTATLEHQTATTRMDALQTWRQRYGVTEDAYNELISILRPSETPPTWTNSGDILAGNLHFGSGSWDNTTNFPLDATSLSTAIDYDLQLETFAEPQSACNWLADRSEPVNHDFNYLDGNGQLFQGLAPTQLHDQETVYFDSNDVPTSLIPAPRQPTPPIAPPLSVPEQKEPVCIRCWRWKKAV
jgi:hypothetical protein